MATDTEDNIHAGRGEIVKGKGRTHLKTELMRESLVSHALGDRLDARTDDVVRFMPWATMLNIGGSILDRGSKYLLPLLDAIVAAKDDHRMMISVGGGVRMRHTFEIAADLKVEERAAYLDEHCTGEPELPPSVSHM